MNKKISNVDTLGALFDRLITERIKHYFFTKEGNAIAVAHQCDIIFQLKIRIADTFEECFIEHGYEVIGEKRTFSLNDIVGEVDTLSINDIQVGEFDRLALQGMKENNSNLMKVGIQGFRTANEKRAKSKGMIDMMFQKIFGRK